MLILTCALSHFSHVWLSVTPWTVAHHALVSMGSSRQEYCSGLPCLPPGDLPDPGIKSASLASPELASGFFTTSAPWEAHIVMRYWLHQIRRPDFSLCYCWWCWLVIWLRWGLSDCFLLKIPLLNKRQNKNCFYQTVNSSKAWTLSFPPKSRVVKCYTLYKLEIRWTFTGSCPIWKTPLPLRVNVDILKTREHLVL